MDVFNLRHSNINDDYIHYVRSKTGVAMQVKITPEMKNIIFSYRRFNNPWIFPFLHEKISGEGEVTAVRASESEPPLKENGRAITLRTAIHYLCDAA